MIDFEADAKEQEDKGASNDQLTRLGELVDYQRGLEQTISNLEERLKDIKASHRKVSEETIPSILDETGLSEVRLKDGTKVIVKSEMAVSTTGKYRDAINKWLEENDYADLIKDELSIPFSRGEEEKVRHVAAFLEEAHQSFDRKRYVASATFKSFIKGLLDEGERPVPLSELGVHIFRKTTLKSPEKK